MTDDLLPRIDRALDLAERFMALREKGLSLSEKEEAQKAEMIRTAVTAIQDYFTSLQLAQGESLKLQREAIERGHT